MIKNLSNMDYHKKRERCGQYIEALEEERRKIHVFQRELPLCLDLVTQAIEACKREIPETTTENVYGQSECSEQTTGECKPVLEQFLTIKDSSNSNEDEEDVEFDDEHGNHDPDKESEDKNMKSDWLKYVQLWNQPDTLLPKEGQLHQEAKRDESLKTDPMINGGEGRKREAEKDGGGGRKQRRCWSSQLHRRFLNALKHLGGPHVATPKQIRELMKVEGLTNDEVKSHLQKYRLHSRRPNQTVPNNGGNSQTQHFVVVGGLWVPQSEYSTGKTTGGATTSTTTTLGVYGAMAAPPPPQWSSHSNFRPSIVVEEGSGSHSGEVVVRCSSPAMSSSTRNHYVKKNLI
ncbi:Transcription factor HRS1 [Cardamine amara subsp. amara]|uniref:Transcription factor HRS1 n=1 Tax=Cardamine amara subsp. amara TaxID=228776 RepID=A0ABD1BBM8_CARAN